MSESKIDNRLSFATDVLAWIFLAFLSMVFFGYFYPHSNHAQTALPLLHVIDPELLTRDSASLSLAEFGPRYFYLRILAVLALFDVDRIPQAFFMLYALTATVLAGGFWHLAKELTDHAGRWVALMMGSLITISVAHAIGMNEYYRPTMTPSVVAGAVAVWAYYFAIRERFKAAYICFGIAALFQLIVASLGAGIITPWLIVRAYKTGKLRELAIGAGVWILAAAAIAIPTLVGGAEQMQTYGYTVIETFGKIRAPHHWVPSSWPSHEWTNLGGVSVFLLTSAIWLRERRPMLAGMAVSGILCTLAALALNYVVVEVYPVTLIAKFQLGRCVPFVQLLVVLVIFAIASNLVEEKRWVEAMLLVFAIQLRSAGIVLAVLGLALALGSARSRRAENDEEDSLAKILAAAQIVLVLGAVVLMGGVFTDSDFLNEMGRVLIFATIGAALFGGVHVSILGGDARKTRLAQTLVLVGLIAGTVHLGVKRNHTVRISNFPSHPLLELAHEMRQRTEKDALFLTPVGGINDVGVYFSLVSHRAVVVNYKNIPFHDAGMFEWRHRLETILGEKLSPTNRDIGRMWARTTLQQRIDAAKHFDADYLVVARNRVPPNYREAIFYANSAFVVLDVSML